MSSSLRLNMASDHETQKSHHETSKGVVNPNGSGENIISSKLEGAKTRGRKPSTTKGPNPKKQPQRGLGVAQLERLRLQERWTKMTEMPQLQPALNFPADHPHPHPQFHFQTEPLDSVPVQYGAASYGGASRFLGVVHHQQQKIAHVAASGYSPVGPAMVDPHCYGNISINGAPMSGQDQVFTVEAGVYDHGRHHHQYETSKELSSMPKMQSFTTPSHHDHQRSDFCFKKTRFSINDENNIGRVREKCPTEILQIGGLNFFRLNNSSSQNVPINSAGDQLALGLGTRPTRSTTNDEGVEVVAVHRKGNSVSGGVFMEYEFFPGKNDSSCRPMLSGTGSKEMMMRTLATTEASVSVAGEASYFTAATTTYNGADISNSVDLSLKL